MDGIERGSVSVVIPCWRCAATIRRCVASVAAQTLQPLEVWVVDDASGDGTAEALHAMAREYPAGWVRVLALPHNVGPGPARNAAWDLARGEYIAFLDADDAWHPEKLQQQIQWMVGHPDVIMTGHRSVPFGDRSALPVTDGTIRAARITFCEMLLSNRFSTRTVVLKREVPFRFDGREVSEDFLLWARMVASASPCVLLDAPLAFSYRYDFDPGGYSGHLWASELRRLRSLFRLRQSGHLSWLALAATSLWSLCKFGRRLLIRASRTIGPGFRDRSCQPLAPAASRRRSSATVRTVPRAGDDVRSRPQAAGSHSPSAESASRVGGPALARNTAWNLAGYGLPLVAAALAIPLLIDGLGVERFGILTLGWVVLGYFHVFDLGLTRATTKLVADSVGTRRTGRIAEYVWAAAAMQLILGLVGASTLIVAAGPLTEWVFEIPDSLVREARLSFLVLATSIPFVFVTGSFQGALVGGQRFDLVNVARVPFSVANYVLPLVGLAVGWSLPGIMTLLAGARVVSLGAHVWLCAWVFPSIVKSMSLHLRRVRELLAFGAWVTVSGAVGPVLVYLDRFVLGTMVSVAAVGYYAAPAELVMRLLIIPGALAATLFPALSTLTLQRETDRARLLIARSTKYLVMSTGLGSIVLIVYAPDIVLLWLGPTLGPESVVVLRILAAGALLNSVAHVPYAALHAHGRPDIPAKFHLLELPAHAALLFILVAAWGTAGAAVAWTVRAGLDAGLLFMAIRRIPEIRVTGFGDSGLVKVLATMAFLVAALLLVSRVVSTPLAGAFVGSALMCIAAIAMVRFGLDEHERAFLRHRCCSILAMCTRW
jgi:O-antigen/teichoic acid export membrane protein/glycosyltransferase involved in cell wall biosynthesis